MKRTIPLLIASIGGIALIIAFFVPATESWGVELTVWFDILAAIAFILGGGNLLKVHLQKVSDRKAGWGYSGLILFSFLLTLFLGLWKLGSHAAPNTEFYGQSFARVASSDLPVFDVAGSIPKRGDQAPLPASVVRQVSQTQDANGVSVIRFQGWPTAIQVSDLLGYQDELEWQCAVEKLAEVAVPPAPLQGRLSYEPDHGALAFEGVMSAADEAALRELFAGKPAVLSAIDQLAAAARRKTTVAVPEPPANFPVAAAAESGVEISGGRMTVTGPVSPGLRSQLATGWPAWPKIHPHNQAQREALLNEIVGAGAALSPQQIEVFDKTMNALWTPVQLEAAINIAGIPAPVDKTACQCLAEKEAGATSIDLKIKPTDPPLTLSADQVAALQRLAFDPGSTASVVIDGLKAAGPLRAAQEGAVRKFFGSLSNVGKFRRDLYFELWKVGPMTVGQRDLLLADYRQEFDWGQAMSQLFLAAHQTKYPSSGDYSEQGTPFWWIYQYVLQPLMTTTFALLAFYVASAAFRAFRAKNLEASLLLGTAFIVLLRSTPFGPQISALVPDSLSFLKLDMLTAFIMKVPNTAGNRAIMIGIALGIAATSLKVLLGLDRSYLGSDE
jgi:hypothetical protein